MTTDDAAVDAERTGRLADSHTEILLADAWLIARIHMTYIKRLICTLVLQCLRHTIQQALASSEIKGSETAWSDSDNQFVLPAQYSNTLRMNKTADFIINMIA